VEVLTKADMRRFRAKGSTLQIGALANGGVTGKGFVPKPEGENLCAGQMNRGGFEI
jgi:hypothetical protein